MKTSMKNIIVNQLQHSISVKELILKDKDILTKIEQASVEIIRAYRSGKKTLLAGNGGSAADAQHIVAEFVSKFYFDRPGLPSIALSTNTSILTAIGNDYDYEYLFARQVETNGVEGDIFIGISTSGNSKNIVEALKTCKQKKIYTIGLTGNEHGCMDEYCDICIKVPSTETPRIQECHILIGHIICCIVEEQLFGHLKKEK